MNIRNLLITFLVFLICCTKEKQGEILVWTSSPSPRVIKVFPNGILKGQITKYYTHIPACNSEGCVTDKLDIGRNKIYIVIDSAASVSYEVEIKKNECYKLEIK